MLDIDCVLRAVAVTQHIYCDARLSGGVRVGVMGDSQHAIML